MTALATRDLAACEDVIERGLATFVEVGEALLRIRDERLYRESFGTFEDYCRERWDLSRKRAYDLTAAAEVDRALSPNGDTPTPRNEAVARELAPLRDEPDELEEVWGEVVQEHGPKPTAAQTREVVQRHRDNGNGLGADDTRPKPEVRYCPTCGHRIPFGQPRPPRKEA